MNMKFSVVMPILNGERFLNSAIASIRAQTHDDWELIIVDGGSTDQSLPLANAHAQEDHRITIVTGGDNGMYDAIFKGFERATGEWLSWLNCDDLYAPWCFATVDEFASDNGASWITGYPGCWDDAGRLRYARPAGLYPQKLIAAGWFHDRLLGYLQQESMFFSRDLLGRLTPEEIGRVRAMRYAGDFLLWRRFAKHARLEVAPTVLGGFRRHEGNLSTRNAEAYAEEVRTTEAFFPPRLLAGLVAAPFRLASSWAMMRAAAKADGRMAK